MADSGFYGEKIGGLYVEIEARAEKLQKDLDKLKGKLAASAKEMSAVANIQPRFDDKLIKMKISDLRKEHARLKAELEKRIQMDVRADSLTGLKKQIGDVEKVMRDAGANISDIPKKVEDSAKDSLNNIRGFATSAKNFIISNLAAIGTFLGVQKLLQLTGESIALAKEQAKAEAQTAQAVKQTGQAAGFTAQQLYKEAAALQAITGVGDELTLQSVTKQLLTFTNIVGDNFKRAQMAVLDLNATINEGSASGLTSQSIQLGKALENPIQGISALSRAGITFTEQQKDLIKSLQESGRLFEAQSIILDEIEAKYGGQAKALADAEAGTKQMTAAFGDFLERVGKKLLPTISAANGFLTRFFDNMLSDAPKTFANDLEEMRTAAQKQIAEFDQLTYIYKDLRSQTELTTVQKQLLKKTIGELQKQYPNYLKNIDLEKGKLSDVEKGFDSARVALKKYLDQKIALAVAENKQTEIIDIGKELYAIEEARANFKAEVEQALQGGAFRGIRFEDQGQLQQAIEYDAKVMNEGLQGRIDLITQKREKLLAEVQKIQETTAKLFEAPVDPKNKGGSGDGINIPVKIEQPEKLDFKINFDYSEDQIAVFEDLKFAANGYLTYALGQIQEETNARLRAGVAKVDAEAAAVEKIRQLYAEYFDWLDERQNENYTKQQAAFARIAEEQEGNWDFVSAGYDSLSAGFNDAMADIKISSDAANSALEKGFIGMANTFISQVKRMLVQWAAFQALRGAASLFGFGLPAQLLGGGQAATGGQFEGTTKGIKRMATGGSFIVPPGYQSDSYPLFVQSGERVTVTPAGQVASQDMMIQQLKNSIGDLGAMILSNRQRFEFRANINGALSGNDIRLSYDRTKRQSGRFK